MNAHQAASKRIPGDGQRRLLLSLIAAATLVCLVVLLLAHSIRSNLGNEVRLDRGKQMQTLLSHAEGVLLRDVADAVHAVESWAEHDEVVAMTPRLLQAPLQSAQGKALTAELTSQLVTGMQLHGLRDYRVLDRNLVIRASLDEALIGTTSVIGRFEETINDAWRGIAGHTPLVIIDAGKGRAAIFTVAPIPHPSGVPQALLVFKVDAVRQLQSVLAHSRRGHSGETYAVS